VQVRAIYKDVLGLPTATPCKEGDMTKAQAVEVLVELLNYPVLCRYLVTVT
jgi:hypothetical protein